MEFVINENDNPCLKFAKRVGLGWQTIHTSFYDEYNTTPAIYFVCDKCKLKIFAGSLFPLSPEMLEFANIHKKCNPSVRNFSIFELFRL